VAPLVRKAAARLKRVFHAISPLFTFFNGFFFSSLFSFSAAADERVRKLGLLLLLLHHSSLSVVSCAIVKSITISTRHQKKNEQKI
jgi:hypothetical protein